MKFLRRSKRNVPSDGTMGLMDHLAELRSRIIRSALAVAAGAIVVLFAYNSVLRFLTEPYLELCRRRQPGFCGLSYDASLDAVNLFTMDPVEGFTTRMRIATYGGVILGLPVILWHIWKFVVPAMHKNERRYALSFIASAVLLFAAGGLLAFSTLGRAIEFLIEWSGEGVDQVFRVSSYIRLVTLMVIAFGIGFTVPVLLVFLQIIGVLTPRALLSVWRYAIVGIVFIAAAITPSGDPVSLASLSVPMILLYFAAIGIGSLFTRRRRAAGESVD
ncbi:MAG: twin-arginine translocase subunit TatC [Ilumatobacteraceae bacterium]|nr:twin-arginine translocase subunit TatC [Ilumatobacteraceae bacterium]